MLRAIEARLKGVPPPLARTSTPLLPLEAQARVAARPLAVAPRTVVLARPAPVRETTAAAAVLGRRRGAPARRPVPLETALAFHAAPPVAPARPAPDEAAGPPEALAVEAGTTRT